MKKKNLFIIFGVSFLLLLIIFFILLSGIIGFKLFSIASDVYMGYASMAIWNNDVYVSQYAGENLMAGQDIYVCYVDDNDGRDDDQVKVSLSSVDLLYGTVTSPRRIPQEKLDSMPEECGTTSHSSGVRYVRGVDWKLCLNSNQFCEHTEVQGYWFYDARSGFNSMSSRNDTSLICHSQIIDCSGGCQYSSDTMSDKCLQKEAEIISPIVTKVCCSINGELVVKDNNCGLQGTHVSKSVDGCVVEVISPQVNQTIIPKKNVTIIGGIIAIIILIVLFIISIFLLAGIKKKRG